jgi:mRNA interferase MazF
MRSRRIREALAFDGDFAAAGFIEVRVYSDQFNHGPAGLVVVVPMTTTERGIPLHVRIDPPEGGVMQTSFAKCEDVRSVSSQRLGQRWGIVQSRTMSIVADRLRILLEL